MSTLFWRLRLQSGHRQVGVGAVNMTAASLAAEDELQFEVLWTAVPPGKSKPRNLKTRDACGVSAGGDVCGHCRADLTDRTRDWVLTDLSESGSPLRDGQAEAGAEADGREAAGA